MLIRLIGQVSCVLCPHVGRSLWTAADALVGLCFAYGWLKPDRGSGAGEGARPTSIYLTSYLGLDLVRVFHVLSIARALGPDATAASSPSTGPVSGRS